MNIIFFKFGSSASIVSLRKFDELTNGMKIFSAFLSLQTVTILLYAPKVTKSTFNHSRLSNEREIFRKKFDEQFEGIIEKKNRNYYSNLLIFMKIIHMFVPNIDKKKCLIRITLYHKHLI